MISHRNFDIGYKATNILPTHMLRCTHATLNIIELFVYHVIESAVAESYPPDF
jgi:hypothetical protein